MDWQNSKNIEGNKYEIPRSWIKIEYYEALNTLFRVENTLRVFVYIILKNEFQEKWKDLSLTSDDEETSTIGGIAKRRISQDKNYAYLGFLISCPIVHLTSGELIRIITSEKYWRFFRDYFPGSKEIIRNKLDEIGNVRNSLAHFRPIKKGDIELIKQNSIHVLSKIELELVDFISCSDRVPTNTEEDWYREMMQLKSEYCSFTFYQTKNEKWNQILLDFRPPKTFGSSHDTFVRFHSFNLKLNGLFNNYVSILKYSISITETNPSVYTKTPLKAILSKKIYFALSNETLKKHFKIIKDEFEKMLIQITTELSLIQQDNLARGKVVESVSGFIEKPENSEYFQLKESPFISLLSSDSPSEFWGNIGYATDNYVTEASTFPWMPEPISDDNDLPF
jgi:hypothetical protein